MTIAVDMGRKATKQNKLTYDLLRHSQFAQANLYDTSHVVCICLYRFLIVAFFPTLSSIDRYVYCSTYISSSLIQQKTLMEDISRDAVLLDIFKT